MDFVVSHHLLPSNILGYSSFTVNLILLLIGIGLSFRGEKSWKLIMLALGAYGGFVITAYILVHRFLSSPSRIYSLVDEYEWIDNSANIYEKSVNFAIIENKTKEVTGEKSHGNS